MTRISQVSAIQRLMCEEARMLARLERLPEAISAYEAIVSQSPTAAQCWFELGLLRRKVRLFDGALDAYDKAIACGTPIATQAHVNRGVIYADYLGDNTAAEKELLQALRLDADFVPALLNLGNLYEDLGRREEARAVYLRVLSRDTAQFEALARYANMHPAQTPSAGLGRQLRSALAHAKATASDRASLGFALGRLLDGSEAYQAAFVAYTAANAASRESAGPLAARYDRELQEDATSRLIRTSSALANKRGPRAESSALPQPIFVCGMFRSGSTLTEHLLASHVSIAAGGELDIIPRYARELVPFPESIVSLTLLQLDALAARYLAEVAVRYPFAARVTDKRPDNFLYIGFIKSLFPTAKIIHTVRNALDNCLSIYCLHLDHGMSYALDLMDIGHYYREYRRLMAYWKAVYGEDIVDFDYDEFVRSPAASGARLFEHLGLDWDDRYLARPVERAIKTASVWQVREPLHTRASGRAGHYGPRLAELARYLEGIEQAERFP